MLPEIAKEWLAKAEEDYGFACAGMECTEYFAQTGTRRSRPKRWRE
jgi:hypothetical protein